ncbi:MAG: hypothetical protein ACK4FB_14205 [Brevundimonas sp.]|uniref:hypothetical protein n=1 Tax=Brevundimonas sp. TaxID=1871086 RepID=UPI00391CDD36
MKSLLAAATITLLLTGHAAAQISPNPNLRPLHGDIHLSGGFLPDPHDLRVNAGGPIRVGSFRSGCSGYVTEAPTVSVHWSSGSGALPLFFTTTGSDRDPTILVRDPSGAWHCDDDGGDGLNPLFEARNARTGRYDVWVGTFSATRGVATFRITELNNRAGGSAPSYSGPLDPTPRAVVTGRPPNHHLSPRFGIIDLSAGFAPDPYTLNVNAGGNISAGDISSSCRGFISEAPTARLQWEGGAGGLPLLIAARSDGDTTLLLRGPDGSWYCDDDGAGGLNPLFASTVGRSGRYDIWVGRYSQGTISAVLSISELIGNVSTAHRSIDDMSDDEYCEYVDWDDPDCW